MSAPPALPALDPAVTSEILEAVAPRLLRRAEKLASETGQWRITDGQTTVVEMGRNTVTIDAAAGSPAQLSCDCLLSPKCAHVAAVCLAAPVAEGSQAQDEEEDDPGEVEEATSPRASVPAGRVAAVLDRLEPVLTEITARGLAGLSVAGHTRLLAAVQAARATGLPRLERELTALATSSQSLRLGRPVGRRALARQVQAVLLTRHLLHRNPGDPRAVGSARRTYRELATEFGPGAGSFTPLFAEPVVSDSGFAGVTVTLFSSQGELFQISRTPPGTAADVRRMWHSPVRLGDLHCSHADLSCRTLLITGGTSSTDGRLGGGRRTRAAQGGAVSQATLRALRLPTGLRLVEATLADVHGAGVETTDRRHFSFLPAARKLGVTDLTSALRGALSRGKVSLTLLVRDNQVLALWADGHTLDPERRILPGLDQVTPAHLPRPVPDFPGEENQPLIIPHRSVAETLWPWLERCASQGAPAIHGRVAELVRDTTALRDLAAPTGAALLEDLGRNPRQLDTVLSVGVYLTAVEQPG